MKNEWKESLAKKYIKEYQLKKVSKDLALRIYSTHLLGNNPELVDKYYAEVQEMNGNRWDTSSLIKRFRK